MKINEDLIIKNKTLGQIETTVEEQNPTILYESSAGNASTNLTLSSDIKNFKKIVIYYYDNETKTYSSKTILSLNASSIKSNLDIVHAHYGDGYPIHIIAENIEFSGTKVTKSGIYWTNMATGGGSNSNKAGSSSFYITKILGYKVL